MDKNNTENSNGVNGSYGDRNSGDWNSGDGNSGDQNSGDQNSGSWNSGNRNSGYLNTDCPKVRIFNKETEFDWNEIAFPDYFYFDLNIWVDESEMSNEEKEENDQYKVTGGYLKVYEYKEAWRKAWDNATGEDRRKTLKLPNWNNELFLEISGIDVEKELSVSKDYEAEEITVNGKKYRLIE